MDSVVSTIVQNCDPEMIVLFGSAATGRTHQDSDLDLLVVMDRRFFRFTDPFDLSYDKVARGAARDALATTRLDPGDLLTRPAPDFHTLTGFPEANPAQAVVGDVGPEARLLILEAATGSGKTEAALWRFTQLLAAGAVSGLYFAVPTRAAARQLHGRVDMAVRRVFGAAAPEAVLAIPGMLRSGQFEKPTPSPLGRKMGRRYDIGPAAMGCRARNAVPGGTGRCEDG